MQDPFDFLFHESLEAKSQILLNYSSLILSGFLEKVPEFLQKTLISEIQMIQTQIIWKFTCYFKEKKNPYKS